MMILVPTSKNESFNYSSKFVKSTSTFIMGAPGTQKVWETMSYREAN